MLRLALLLLALALAPLAQAHCAQGAAVFTDPGVAMKSTDFHAYRIQLYHQPGCEAEPDSRIAGLQILQDGKRVYAQTGYSFAIGYALDADQSPDSVKVDLGMDLTGLGQPDLLISEWSGGSHCCYLFHVFELGADFRKVQDISLYDADESAFVRRPGVAGLLLNVYDYSAFAYFPFDFAGSPAGRVLLRYQGTRFQPDLARMRAKAPADAQLKSCAALFKKSPDWKNANAPQPLGMWYYATDLIYSGNEAQAWTFLGDAWGGSGKDRDQYLADYRKRLGKSIYYGALQQLRAAAPTTDSQNIDWDKQCFAYLHG